MVYPASLLKPKPKGSRYGRRTLSLIDPSRPVATGCYGQEIDSAIILGSREISRTLSDQFHRVAFYPSLP
jgi:hypothetical protein